MTNLHTAPAEILIIEGSPTQAAQLQFLLEDNGYRVAHLPDAESALTRLTERRPQLVIADVVLPGMNGFDFCRRVKAAPALHDLPVVLVTTLSDAESALKALESGADGFLVKPYSEEVLLGRIRHVVETRTVARKQGERPEVLVVEDSPTQATQLRLLLEASGYAVRTAPEGEAALAAVRRRRPTLVISDILMPGMDGLALCRAIKQDPQLKRLPVVLVSQLTGEGEVRRALEAQADDYLPKPVNEEDLLRRVETVLARTDEQELHVVVDGRQYQIAAGRRQMFNFFLSAYENAVYQNRQLEETRLHLQHTNQRLEDRLRELHASEDRFRTVVLTVPDIVYRLDPKGRFVFLNEAVSRLGYRPEELIGKHFSEILLPAEVEEASRERVLPRYAGRETGPEGAPKLFDERRTKDRKTTGLQVRLVCREDTPGMAETSGEKTAAAEVNSSGLYEVNPFTNERAFVGAVGVIRDISDRQQDRATLQFQKSLLEAQTEAAMDGILVVSPEGEVLSANLRLAEQWGLSRDEIMQLRAEEILAQIHGEVSDPRVAEQLTRLHSESQESAMLELSLRDGRHFDVYTAPVNGPEGVHYGRVWYCRNVTDQRQAAEAVRSHRDELEGLVAERTVELEQEVLRTNILNDMTRILIRYNTLQAILTNVLPVLEKRLDLDGAGVSLHDAERNVFRIVALGPEGRALCHDTGLCVGVEIPVENTVTRRCLAGELVYLEDLTQVDSPGARMAASGGLRSCVAAPLTVEGQVLGILYAVRRTSRAFAKEETAFLGKVAEHVALALRQARMYEDLQGAYAELASAQQQVVQQERLRALGEMASGVAHDFNNALMPVVGFSDLLLRRPEVVQDTEKVLAYLETINTAARDAAAVVDRLREFYREKDEQEVLQPVDLSALVEQVVTITQPKWKDQAQVEGTQIEVLVETKEVPAISGNEANLREALTNLVFNAVDAMRRKAADQERDGSPADPVPVSAVLTLRVRPDGDPPHHVVVEVSDTGAGMSKEVRRKCLEPFFTTKETEGTGLGLAMVYGIVQRHSGTIDIESEEGQGTTFRLRFPLRVEEETGRQTKETPTEKSSPLRVLVAEDEDLGRELLVEYLTQEGHTVVACRNGAEALSRFEPDQFDLVVTDRAMPELNGDGLAAAVKQRAPDMPVVMITGFGAMMRDAGELPPGVDLVIGKPFDLADLRQATQLANPTA